MSKLFAILRPHFGRGLLLALICLLPWQTLYAATAPQPAPTHATAAHEHEHACKADSGMTDKADCETPHCTICTPVIAPLPVSTFPVHSPVLVATHASAQPDVMTSPERKPQKC